MKWLVVAACLNCGAPPEPFPVAIVTDVDRATCAELAALTVSIAQADLPPGTVAGAWCMPIDDWQDGVDAYPQGR